MAWPKIKNIIILMLLVTNLCLLAFVGWREIRDWQLQDKALEQAVSFLAERGIQVDERIVPRSAELPPIGMERDLEEEQTLAAALLGVIFATFGISAFDSIVRYDFGSVNMQSGSQQLVVLIGLYAVPEVVAVAQKVVKPKEVIVQNTTVDKIHGLGFTWKEFKSQIVNFFIAAFIGTGIGILPGIGGGTAGIMSYTTIKNRSKTPE